MRQFQTTTVSECGLIKLFPRILFQKHTGIYILALEMASPLCQLHRRTFVPYCGKLRPLKSKLLLVGGLGTPPPLKSCPVAVFLSLLQDDLIAGREVGVND